MDDNIVTLPERLKPKRKYSQQPNFLTNNKRDELSVMEKKILYLVMNQLDDTDITRDKYTILACDLDTNTVRIQQALRKILARRIQFVNSKMEAEEIVPFIGYYYHKNKGLITMTLHPDALPVFYDKKRGYTSFVHESAMQLRSKYSQKLYEILSRWKDKKTLRLDVADLKRDLCAEDKEYGNFKRRCLNLAIREINEKTEISVSYSEERTGRNVTCLILCLVEKEKENKNRVLTEIQEDQDQADELSPADVHYHVHTTFKHYTFTQAQREMLIADRALFKYFIKLHNLLEAKLIPKGGKLTTTPTRYLAACLFKRKAA